jgi:ABC-type nitrate/sulfonate/bicarbonate transport system permease component
MNNFQTFLAFCGIMMGIIMILPSRANRAFKPIIAILKALPTNGLIRIIVAMIRKK